MHQIIGLAFAVVLYQYLLVLAVFWLVCAAFSAALAYARGRSAVGWFLLALLFGPFALLVVFFKHRVIDVTKSRAKLGYTDNSDPP